MQHQHLCRQHNSSGGTLKIMALNAPLLLFLTGVVYELRFYCFKPLSIIIDLWQLIDNWKSFCGAIENDKCGCANGAIVCIACYDYLSVLIQSYGPSWDQCGQKHPYPYNHNLWFCNTIYFAPQRENLVGEMLFANKLYI